MTRYEQGFMSKCAEYGVDGAPLLAKMAQEAYTRVPEELVEEMMRSYDKRQAVHRDDVFNNRIKGITPYINATAPGGDIHKPISAPAMASAYRTINPGRAATRLPRAMGNYLLQRYIDSLPDPGPSVRNPTAYEVGQLLEQVSENLPVERRLRKAFQHTGRAVDKASDLYGGQAAASMLWADPKLQDEALRRSWHSATSAVPISAVSPVPAPAVGSRR